jgi:hypothetical protein
MTKKVTILRLLHISSCDQKNLSRECADNSPPFMKVEKPSQSSKQLSTGPHFGITLAPMGSRVSSVGIVTGTGLDGRDSIPGNAMNHMEHTDTVLTSQKTDYVSATVPSSLILFGETVAVYCENPT